MLATLPFSHVLWRMKIELVHFVVLWLNAFPAKSGVSSMFSPRELLLRWRLDYKKHCRVVPGTYCEVHDEPSPTNTMTSHTHESIALGLTGDLQGSVKFYCIHTGRVLKRCSFTPMPMPDRVIKRVNAIGKREGQGQTFRFVDQHKEPYEWTDEVLEDDPDFQSLLEEGEDVAPYPYPDIPVELPGVELEVETPDYKSAITDDPRGDFRELANAALHNVGIDADDALQRARDERGDESQHGLALVEADEDEIMYGLTFDLLDAGLEPELGNALDDTSVVPVPAQDDADTAETGGQRYPT